MARKPFSNTKTNKQEMQCKQASLRARASRASRPASAARRQVVIRAVAAAPRGEFFCL